jgi:hypothetical protein
MQGEYAPDWYARFLFQRGLGLVYTIAFLVALNQFRPLVGEHGLLPAPLFMKEVPFRNAPSLFYLFPNDHAFRAAAWVGLVLSCLALTGISERYGLWFSMLIWALLWAVYLSFVNIGQTFYGFGWESMLLEAGFLTIFLGSNNVAPRTIGLWLVRWMEFRVMFGAGLIKLRGDNCWKDLTCLDYHYETQPMPNPLSWYFHHMPAWTHSGGVLFNHFVELVVPFAYFLPQPIATVAGALTIAFQALLMLSGNLSFLNLLTIVLAIPLIDGRLLAAVLPVNAPPALAGSKLHLYMTIALAVLVGILSIQPVANLFSSRQLMNFAFSPLQLVNTYGAFGSVTRTRYEVVVEGASEAVGPWREYEFKGKPGDPMHRPPQIAPCHLRLDWLMWFAAMSSYRQHPWFVNLAAKLLQGDRAVLGLLRTNPFPDRPPRYVRARLWEYHFTTAEEKARTGAWWNRKLVGFWFPELSLDDPRLQRILQEEGWL